MKEVFAWFLRVSGLEVNSCVLVLLACPRDRLHVAAHGFVNELAFGVIRQRAVPSCGLVT